jgi:putative endonuclease
MPDSLLDIAYARAQQAQQHQLKRRRLAAKRALRTASSQGDPAALMAYSPTQQIGNIYESRALEWLTQAGLIPLARNWRCRTGEIDLIMRDGHTLVLIEVRARSCTQYGGAAASITYQKQQRLIRSAALLLPTLTQRYWHGQTPKVRFDVVAFDDNQITWLPDAIHLKGIQ